MKTTEIKNELDLVDDAVHDAELSYMNPDVVMTAYNRIKKYVHKTPLLQSDLLNKLLQADIYFKCENMQKVGAFKVRGALNTLLHLQEKNQLPQEVVAYSSGNHAQAVAWAAQQLGIKATIFMPSFCSALKIAATKSYGAQVVFTQERQEAEQLALEKSQAGAFLLPPYDHDDVIAGQGTAVLEAWLEEGDFDAVFIPCGGGGLISGSYLATRLFSSTAQIYGCEPTIANDAASSYATGRIHSFEKTPMTIADGARTLYLSQRTFQYVRQLQGFYEISEDDIVYWTQWITHLLKVVIEPTSALGLAGACEWIKAGNKNKKILIILSGGNLDYVAHAKIWEKSYLEDLPNL